MNHGDADAQRLLRVLNTLSQLQGILHTHSAVAILPLEAAQRFQALVRSFLQEYSLLVNAADRESAVLFAMVPKHHWFWHLGDRALWINPRRSCCLIDEDYVGKMKLVVAACAHGPATHEVQNKVAEQYRFGWWFRLRFGAEPVA